MKKWLNALAFLSTVFLAWAVGGYMEQGDAPNWLWLTVILLMMNLNTIIENTKED